MFVMQLETLVNCSLFLVLFGQKEGIWLSLEKYKADVFNN